jgi:hypothetical protein
VRVMTGHHRSRNEHHFAALSHLLHREATTQGVRLLDLAISGSTAVVEAGTVTLACRWGPEYLRAMHSHFTSPLPGSGS